MTWAKQRKKNFTLNPLTSEKLRINGTFKQQMAFFGHFRSNPREKCFLAWTVAVSFRVRSFSSILSSGMRTIPNFEFFYARNSTLYGSSRFSAQDHRFRFHFGSRFLLSN